MHFEMGTRTFVAKFFKTQSHSILQQKAINSLGEVIKSSVEKLHPYFGVSTDTKKKYFSILEWGKIA